LSRERALHAEIRRDYDARPPPSLAARHAAARVSGRADGALRCIDCHGGKSFAGRLRVKALAAKDALVYVSGRFEEPETMRWPLWDEDCSACHASFETAGDGGSGSPAFHELPVHNADLGVACVECHPAHEAGGNPGAFFLRTASARAVCRCHSEFEPGG
jgi:hypothetical protein